MTPQELLRKHPYNPRADARKLLGAAKLSAVPDGGDREALATIWIRNQARWEADAAAAEQAEADAAFDVPDLSDTVPDDEDVRALWDRRNGLLNREWRAFWERIGERERELRAERGAAFRGLDRAAISHRFRRHLTRVYGQGDPSEAWKLWDEQRQLKSGKVAR